ncbi:hypothetical protein BKA93DRAFT_752042 [Sparassis latifolia]
MIVGSVPEERPRKGTAGAPEYCRCDDWVGAGGRRVTFLASSDRPVTVARRTTASPTIVLRDTARAAGLGAGGVFYRMHGPSGPGSMCRFGNIDPASTHGLPPISIGSASTSSIERCPPHEFPPRELGRKVEASTKDSQTSLDSPMKNSVHRVQRHAEPNNLTLVTTRIQRSFQRQPGIPTSPRRPVAGLQSGEMFWGKPNSRKNYRCKGPQHARKVHRFASLEVERGPPQQTREQ